MSATGRMKNKHLKLWGSASMIALAAAQVCFSGRAVAQDEPEGDDVIVVTATRRSESIQDVPLNIAAITGGQIEEQGIVDLAQIADWIPGIHVVDQGGRGSDRIVVRGLNADPLGSAEGINNDGGGTVATYVGEIPLFIDLKLNDMERVEVLLGPQGTLYGAGTLGGAVRYIPNRPQFDENTLQVRAEAYDYSEGADISTDTGFTANMALHDKLALRISMDYLNDRGFIDYPFVVQEIGVSEPDPDFSDPAELAANFSPVEDANTEETLSARVGLRFQPIEAIDANFTWYHQSKDVGARQISSMRTGLPVGEYESALRVVEPNKAINDLFAFELVADLGFAELTSATGYSNYEEGGQRDQTDLLITLEYSYELFPTFTAFTREDQDDDRFNQELRLVSTHGGPISWIVGGFYNKLDSFGSSQEFTPHYDEYLVDIGAGVQLRPDVIEYWAITNQELTETAFFGEVSYEITPAWQVTVGTRRYEYEFKDSSATDLPLLRTVFGGDDPNSFVFDFLDTVQEDDGWLYKFNTSYDVTDDILVYVTASEGYRIGGFNGVSVCEDPLPPGQNVCALPANPDETQFFPDKTQNYEIGAHTEWLDDRLTVNGAIYYIDWKDPQVSGATLNGAAPITRNGTGAESKGVELSFSALVTEALSLRGSYAWNEAELSAVSPDLITFFDAGTGCGGSYYTNCFEDGQPGDRLPGFSEHQASLFAAYTQPAFTGVDFDANLGVSYRSEVETRTGGRGGGITLDGYTMTNASVGLSGDVWTLALYANNLFDEYAETGARSTPLSLQPGLTDDAGGLVNVRSHYAYVHPPRVLGVRMTYDFGG